MKFTASAVTIASLWTSVSAQKMTEPVLKGALSTTPGGKQFRRKLAKNQPPPSPPPPTPPPTAPWTCPDDYCGCEGNTATSPCTVHSDCDEAGPITWTCKQSGGDCTNATGQADNSQCNGGGDKCNVQTQSVVLGTCVDVAAPPTPPPTPPPTSSPVSPTPPPTPPPTSPPTPPPTPPPVSPTTPPPAPTYSLTPSPSCPGGGYICTQNSDWGNTDLSKWNLHLQLESLPGGVPQAYVDAATKWMSLIVGQTSTFSSSGYMEDSCANPYPAQFDDLHICGRDEVIDGAYGVLGSAGPMYYSPGTSTATAINGNMRFDIDDIGRMVTEGTWEGVILHEMGHVIGIGTLWEIAGHVGSAEAGYPYSGPLALAVWSEIWGCTGTPPVETDGGGGTAGGHWDETCMTNELMTGWANSGGMPLSELTAAALDDLGYTIDYDSPFLDRTYTGASTNCCGGGRRNLRNLQGRRPADILDVKRAVAHGKKTLLEYALPPGKARVNDDGVVYVADLMTSVFFWSNGEIHSVDVTSEAYESGS